MRLVWCALVLLAMRVHADPHEAVITLNTVRAVRRTAEPFIGFSVSPQILFNNHYSVSTVRMLAALSPAVLRIGDEDSDKLVFRSSNGTPGAVVFSELQWAGVNTFAAEARLNLIFSMSPHSDWKQLLNSSRKLGFNPSWQLGYKLKKNESSHEFGEGLVQLRQNLNNLQLQHSAVFSPDFQVCNSCNYERQISDIFQEAGDLINVITLQLDPLESKEDEKLAKLVASVERATKKIPLKSGRFRNGAKKQIWIAESSGPEEGYSGDFSDAQRWALKLGVLAQAGVDSVLRRPSQLVSPSPDYWVSLLHRRLVGPAVLGLRLSAPAGVRAFAHCAAARPGVVVWGVNRGPAPARLTLRAGPRLDTAELFLLTRDAWEDADVGSTLLNGQLLHLNAGVLPNLSGRTIPLGRNMSLTLPPESVFFVLLPLRVPACLLPPARAPTYEPQLPTAKIPTSDLLNAAVLPPNHKGDFDLEKGGLFDMAGKERQSRGNAKEDVEMRSKLILEGLKAHANGYDNQGEENEFGKHVDMTLAATDDGGVMDELETRRGDSKIVTTEESGDGMPMMQMPLPVVAADNVDNFELDGTQVPRDDHDSKTISLSLIPPKEKSTDERDDAILTMSFNPGQTRNPFRSSLAENKPRIGEVRESKITRIKRAENEASLIVEPPEGIEDSLLYKRFQFLRKSRNLTKIAKGRESKKENPLQNSGDMNPVDNTKDLNHHISGTVNQINKIVRYENRAAFKSPIAKKSNNSAALHYHPGEFYETLGSLRIDKNVTLKDIEKADEEAIDLMIEKKQQQTSESTVSSKRSSEQHSIERNIDESTTENAEKYFKCDDKKTQRVTSGSRDKTVNDNGKCSSSEQHATIHHSSENRMDARKKTVERIPENVLDSSQRTAIKADDNDYGQAIKAGLREKRELGDISNITTILFPKGDNSTSSNHSVKPQIGMYVIDQSEGRKLFLEATVEEQGLEKSYENVTSDPPKIKIVVGHRNKTNDEPETDSNLFLLNNLVIDNKLGTPLKKKTYHDEPEKVISKNIQTALKDGDHDEGLTQSLTPGAFIIELNESGILPQSHSGIDKSSSEKEFLNQHDEMMNSSKIPVSYEESNNKTPKKDSLLSLLMMFSPDFKRTTTGDGENMNRLDSEILVSNNRNHPEENIKNSSDDNSKRFRGPILGSVQALPSGKKHSVNKKKPGLLQKVHDIDTFDIPEGNNYPHNTQSPLKASSSILISKIAQESPLPPLNPILYDLTTEPDTLSYPLQKPKTHLHSSSFIGGMTPIAISPTLHQTQLTEPHLSKMNVQNRHGNHYTSHRGRTSTLEMLIAKHKEKLDALKLRLQQAKEKAMEAKRNKIISHYSATNPHEVVKRSIFTIGGANRIQGGRKIGFNFPGNKGLIKLLEDGVVKSSLPYETNFKHKTGQITTADMKDTSSEEFSLPQTSPKNQATMLKISPRLNPSLNKSQLYDNVRIEENLEIENLAPESVNLWEDIRWGKPAEHGEVLRPKRKPRAIHYPCMRDLFFSDYDTEDRAKILNTKINSGNKRSLEPSGKNAPEKTLPAEENNPTGNKLILTENNSKVKLIDFNREKQSKKSKRSVDGVLNGEEAKFLDILTNEITTSNLADEISDNRKEGDDVLHKIEDKINSMSVPGKSGIFKLYELAKEYQKTRPDSLELYGSSEKSTYGNEKRLESLEEMGLDMEVQDSEERLGNYGISVTANPIHNLSTHIETQSNSFADKATGDSNHLSVDLQESAKEIGNSNKSKQFIDSLIEKIKLIMRDITSTVKHGLL